MPEWRVVSERPLYGDEWLDIRIADVELPDGRHIEHRSIRIAAGAGVLALDRHQQVLLIWRHRFITGTWGWEIPMGRVEEDESPADAAAREFEEETGWRAAALRPLIRVRPTPGISNSVHHIYRADEATHIGEPVDAYESDRIAWVPLADVRSLIDRGDIVGGSTLVALLYILSEPVLSIPGRADRRSGDGPDKT